MCMYLYISAENCKCDMEKEGETLDEALLEPCVDVRRATRTDSVAALIC